MKCWLQFHFLGSPGDTTYVRKLNTDISSSAAGICSIAMRHSALLYLSHWCFLKCFWHLSPVLSPFCFSLIHLPTCFFFWFFLLPFVRRAISLPLSLSSSCSLSQVCLSAISSLYTSTHTDTARTKDNICYKGSPGGFLIQAAIKRHEHLTINGCSKLHLQQRRQSLFLSYAHAQQALR